MSEAVRTTPPVSIWQLQLLHLVTGVVLVALWVFLAPALVSLPPGLEARLGLYSLIVMPFVGVLVVFNHRWIRPVLLQWGYLVSGQIEWSLGVMLFGRIRKYPYRICWLSLGAVLAGIAVVSTSGAAIFDTPRVVIAELVLVASAFAFVFAGAVFFIGRLIMEPLLRLPPGMGVEGEDWEDDLHHRGVLAACFVAIVVWLLLAAVELGDLRSSGMIDFRTIATLAVGGTAFVAMVAVMAWLWTRDLAVEPRAMADELVRLAHSRVSPKEALLAVTSSDEYGVLIEAFNMVASRLADHESALLQSAHTAEEADKRQAAFFSEVSQGLRMPLHSIVRLSEALLKDGGRGLDPEQQSDVLAILKGARHLQSLVDLVVDHSKLDVGAISLCCAPVDLAEVVHEALDAASVLRKNPRVSLRADVGNDVPALWADKLRLRQILFNLVGNALKFTTSGEVAVLANRVPFSELVAISIRDTGPGIPEEHLERMFGEFEQVHHGFAEEEIRGTGLGLSIVRQLVAMHGGKIRVANRPEGGAEFTFTLPIGKSGKA